MNYTAARIFRPLNPESRNDFAFINELPNVFPNQAIEPLVDDNLGVTLIGVSAVSAAASAVSEEFADERINKIIYPFPQTGNDIVVLPTGSVKNFPNRDLDVQSLFLFLDDKERRLGGEFQYFKNRVGNAMRQQRFMPRLVLARVGVESRIGDIIEWVNTQKPKSVVLESVTTNPLIAARPYKTSHVVRSEVRPITEPVRVINSSQKPPKGMFKPNRPSVTE